MAQNDNVVFKTSTTATIDDLFNWNKSTGQITAKTDNIPIVPGTVYFTADGHIVHDLAQNNRLWMSKNAYSAIYAEDVTETNTDIANAIKYSIHYVEGPTTDTTAGTWTGTINSITELYDGLTIIYVPAVAGGSSTTTLNINELGAKTCYYSNTSAITTHYSVGTPILLTYRNNCWRRADYNSNTTYSAMSVAEMRAGTATSARTIRSDYLKTFLSTLGGTNLTLTHSNSAPYLQLNHDPSGITAGTYGNSSQQTPSYGGTFNIPYFTVDAQGHITNASVTTVKIPESNNTDYKVRQTSINSNDNNNYRILLSNSANDTSEDSISKKNANLIYNPTKNKLSTGNLDLTGNINVVGDATFNNTTTIDNAILNSLLVSGNSSFVNNVNFTQIPTAPTATAGTNTTQIATTEFVTNAVAQGFVVNDAMVFKGLIGSNQLITQLPTSGYNAGWTYRVADAGIFAGEYCEVGDLLIAINDGPASGSSVRNTDWGKVEHNIDGAVFRGSGASNSSVGSSTQPVYVNGSGIVTAITSLGVEAGGTGKDSRRKAGLFYDWTASLKGQKWSRICYIPRTSNLLGSTMILNIRHTRSGVVYNETVIITVHHNSKGNITSLSSSNYNQNSSIQIRALANSSGDCYIELKDSNQEIAEGTTISPVYCTLQIITLGDTEPTLKTSFEDGTTLPENYSVTAEVTLGRNRIITSGRFSGNLEGNAATATALATGRTLKVNLASTSASTAFNGTANITDIGVSGILPIAQGGTNSSTTLIANRLMRSNSNGNAIVCSSNIYSDGSKLGVNTSSVTSGYYFEVNGASLFKNNVFIGTDSDTITKNIFVKNANGTIALTAGTSGARGLYDTTNNRWMLYYSPGVSNDSNGIVRISTWANKGSSSTPIYFNSNGEPQAITSPLPVTLGGTGQSNTNNFVKVYTRSQMGDSINYDDPGVNGLFEAMRSSEITVTGKWPGGNDHEGYFPLLSLSTSVAMMQIAGNTASNYGWWIRGKQGTNVTLEGVDWERLVTNSGTWDINITGNAATATTAGGITSAGTTAQFWRGDNSWSNVLKQPTETTLGINTSDLRIGTAVRTLHIATSDNGTGAGITDGDAAGITFGFSNAAYSTAYAGIYYQSSNNYGSRLYFATTGSFGNGAYARMMITHDGKVGINTLSPSARLHVKGDVIVTSLNASQAVSTDANKKLISKDLTTAEPATSGPASETDITYIATISQNAVGKISATKRTVRNASTSQTGVLQFTSANTSAQINTLSTESSVPYDDDYFISQHANGGISNTNYYRRPISTLYTYIKNKALANESDFLPNLKVNPITIRTVSGKKSYLDIETLLQWFITTEKISTSLQYHKTFIVGWEFASNDYLQFTYDGQNYEFNLAGTVIEFIGKTAGINETTNKADGQFRLILHVPPANPPAQTAGYVVPGYGSYIKYSVNGSGTNRSSKLTFINNKPQYYANEKIEYAASYNKTPEVANIKLNGNTSATAASTKNVQLVYDTSLEVLNFVFS